MDCATSELMVVLRSTRKQAEQVRKQHFSMASLSAPASKFLTRVPGPTSLDVGL